MMKSALLLNFNLRTQTFHDIPCTCYVGSSVWCLHDGVERKLDLHVVSAL